MNFYTCVSEKRGALPVPVYGAQTFVDRFRGLMFRPSVNFALWLRPCASIHTFGMRFPLHILFLDGEGQVLRVLCRVSPGKTALCRIARSVLEVPSSLMPDEALPQVGDYLSFRTGTPAKSPGPALSIHVIE